MPKPDWELRGVLVFTTLAQEHLNIRAKGNRWGTLAASKSARPDSDVPTQFDDRVNSTEVICSGFNLDFDCKD